MQEREYEMLVWGLQGEAQDRPDFFHIKVVLISLFAYLVLLILLILSAYFMFTIARGNSTLVTKIVLVSLFMAALPILLITLRMFFTRIPVPIGRELTEQDAPQLYKIVSDLRERIQGVSIHHILITKEFNAAIAQCPRFGLFGGYRNYLILGLPLLYSLSEEEMVSVLAHEYGHLAGGHGKLSHWIYRQRATFGVLYEHARVRRDESGMNGFFAALLDWFAPYYNAYTFVLSRQNEYEADAVSCRIVGEKIAASGLIRIALLATWLQDNFWPKLYAQSERSEMPMVMPYVAMRKLLVITMDEWATKARLEELWQVESNVYDTHPCLSERVTAMAQTAVLPVATRTNAADVLLGKLAVTIAQEFDEEWWLAEKDKWQKYHRRFTRSKIRINELEQQPVSQLTIYEAQELALLLVEFCTVAAAKSVLEDLLGRTGERYPKPIFYYGRALLEEGNAKGLDYLEEAFKLSPTMANDCTRVGYQWICEQQSEAAAEKWLLRFQAIHSESSVPPKQ